MSHGNFPPSLAAVLLSEGGYSNDPADPGGSTNRGITQAVYGDWRADRGLPLQSVKQIDPSEVSEIYRNHYWNPVRGDDLPSGVDYLTFDFAVNSGVNRAIRFLQRAAGLVEDGYIGPVTLAKVSVSSAEDLIDTITAERISFLEQLKAFPHFGKGWVRRANEVRDRAKAMA